MRFFGFCISVVSLAFLLSSCSKSDVLSGSENRIIGDWWISDVQFEGTSTTNSNGNDITSPFTGTGYNLVLNMNIEKEQNAFSTKGLYNIHLVTEIEGEFVQTEWMNPGFIECGTWTIKDDNLVVTKANGETSYATVISLSDNTLVLAYNFSYEVMKSETKVNYMVEGLYTFSRR